MNWQDDVTPREGLTFYQWVIREGIRLQKWAEYYWDAIDAGNELSVTEELIRKYNEVCDMLDMLESDPRTIWFGGYL